MKAYRTAQASVLATFILLLIGGAVNPTGSSLACPDWPTCYGSFFPEMKGGVFYEHGHRVAATLVGLCTILLLVLVGLEKKADRFTKGIAAFALFMVIFQGVLGGVTVIYKLPTLVSTTHLGIAMFFFSLMIYLTMRLRWQVAPSAKPLAQSLAEGQRWAALAGAAIYLQIMLGALMRHTGAGRACGTTIPFCGEDIWPVWGPAQLHMLHRYFAFVVMGLVIFCAIKIAKLARANELPGLAKIAGASHGLVTLQVILGFLTVYTGIQLHVVVAHLGFGALLLGVFVVLLFAFTSPKLGTPEAVPGEV